tara:strand:- start:211 stop:480 length:270 start_codon:yes stop_codon:yes gene_type:complete
MMENGEINMKWRNKKKYIVFSLMLYGCSTIIELHPLTDRYSKVHYYNKKVSVYHENVPSAQFCQSHYVWETINSYYGKYGIKYVVKKGK